MKTKSKFVVRVLFNDLNRTESLESFDHLSDAIEQFIYYVRAVLEFNLNVRVVNIFKGKKSIKMFQNYLS